MTARRLKVPAGGAACPSPLMPQQASVPSVLTAQVWKAPALTVVYVPAGGEACPKALWPQQASVPSVLTAQVCRAPAVTVV